jgi:hypothetical protein
MHRRPHEAVNPLWGGGLDVQVTAALSDGFLQMLCAPRRGEELVTEPRHQGLPIGNGGFAEAQVLPNLRPMILYGTTVPVILGPDVDGDTDLLGEMFDHYQRYILGRARKMPRILEEL